MAKAAIGLIEETRTFWGRKTGRILTYEDAREILTNVTGFFQLLEKWDKEQQTKRAHGDGNRDEASEHRKEIA